MIPRAHVTAWRNTVPWAANAQVEQDLVICRALVSLFSSSTVASKTVFRGGTALHKLHLDRPLRFSEDIDLTQYEAEPIGDLLDAVHEALDPWLGQPRWKKGQGRFTLQYGFDTSYEPVVKARLKVEINTREHGAVGGVSAVPFSVGNPWFSGEAAIPTFSLEEILGTKMRALYQRKKGRDLFDLWISLASGRADPEGVVDCFRSYMEADEASVSRGEYERNLLSKIGDRAFLKDIRPLLPVEVRYDPRQAAEVVLESLVARLDGEP